MRPFASAEDHCSAAIAAVVCKQAAGGRDHPASMQSPYNEMLHLRFGQAGGRPRYLLINRQVDDPGKLLAVRSAA